MLYTPTKKAKQRYKKAFNIAAGLYFLIGITLYMFQEKLLFFPSVLEQNYNYISAYNFEELNLNTKDNAILNALHYKTRNPKGVILYFHGNAGNLSRWSKVCEFFVAREYDVLVMDYRTYGKSRGKLSEQAFYEDAQLFYNYLLEQYDASEITIYGRSLGTGIATYVASINKPKQLILETPYSSITDVAKHRFPLFPVKWLLRYKFPSANFITTVACPITIFHGTNDAIVPYKFGKKLAKKAKPEQVNFITIYNGNHNNLNSFKAYLDGIDKVLK